MAEIDKSRVEKMLKEVKGYKGKIEETVPGSKKDFLSDEKLVFSVRYLFLVIIEAMGSIALHILAKKFSYAPDGIPDSFKQLADKGVISEDLSKRLVNMAKFRNILIHHYWKIDDEKVFNYVVEELDDIDNFVREIEELISGSRS